MISILFPSIKNTNLSIKPEPTVHTASLVKQWVFQCDITIILLHSKINLFGVSLRFPCFTRVWPSDEQNCAPKSIDDYYLTSLRWDFPTGWRMVPHLQCPAGRRQWTTSRCHCRTPWRSRCHRSWGRSRFKDAAHLSLGWAAFFFLPSFFWRHPIVFGHAPSTAEATGCWISPSSISSSMSSIQN